MTPKALSREIKFRAWSEKHKMMSEPFTLLQSQGSKADFTDSIFIQFTGLPDKNGKEIYEGDIVKWKENWLESENGEDKEFIAEVAWGIGKAGFIFTGGKHSIKMVEEIFQIVCKKCEIIGNIYENPELLTKENK